MILFVHNRYRTVGGEERSIEDLMWLVSEHLGEDAELLERRSDGVGRPSAAAGLLGGGLAPDQVATAVRRTRARIVHAHNIHPTLGWRALAAARAAGARVVLHLHQYRLVCAVGVCFRDGAPCTRCHGRNTLPGIVLNCRRSRAEALAYGAGLALWQRRLIAQVDMFIAPSAFAHRRLLELGTPVGPIAIVPHVTRAFAPTPAATPGGPALLAARLVPEKGIAVAIEACRLAGVELVVAGEGPERARLETARGGGDRRAVLFTGRLDPETLARLRATASVALVPSLYPENLPQSAVEALAAGLPVAGSRIGGMAELVPEDWLTTPGDASALAATIGRLARDRGAGDRALAVARARTSPEVVAAALAAAYGAIAS